MKHPSSFPASSYGESEDVFAQNPGLGLGARRAPAWLLGVWDGVVGMVEKRRDYPSDRARQEYLSYYAGLYQEHGPDPAHFRQLLRRNGPPFIANPFPEGSPEHYLYHAEGLILADLESLLGSQVRAWREMGQDPQESDDNQPHIHKGRWLSIDQALELQKEHLLETEDEWALDAGVCWGMTILYSDNLEWVKERVHSDNLAWATVHALQRSPWEKWGVDPQQVVSRAVAHGLFSEKVASHLFSKDSHEQD